ncbi:DUF6530 family protein [Paenibacillus wulumuqiensis]|uniref:DUF6530 family protein n=1 Tax=Paenibacillus wulumuqiensis TaxID=1567107 RepID=UPI0006197CA2|nr:DUF6530 family protein [Paenibacillus wulumuqiensis]
MKDINEMKDSRHRPVILSANYDQVDGQQAGQQEVEQLSLGLQTGRMDGRADIVAQLWRDATAQKEGLLSEWPIHRILDASILICRSLDYFQEAYRQEQLYDPEHPVFDRIPLQGAALSVGICTDNSGIDGDIQDFQRALEENGYLIGERLRILARLLEEMGY